MRVLRDKNPRLQQFARQMRASSTDAEKKLWSILRGRALSGFKFRRQYPVGGYIVDFFCVEHRLAIELDGGQHNDPGCIEYDLQRTTHLKEMGVQVVRFWDHDVLKEPEIVAEEILRQLEKPSPQPSPGVPGEGERKNLSQSIGREE